MPRGRGGEEGAVAWTVAGTVGGDIGGGEGSKISIRDRDGKSFTLTANQAGNFYTREPVAPPLTVAADGRQMPGTVDYGGCNRCHGSGGDGGGRG